MRGKEGAADYRYFPEPDVPPVILDEETIAKFSQIPELPDQKKARYMKEFKLSAYDAAVICEDLALVKYFETMINNKADPKLATNWMMVELLGRLKKTDFTIESSPVSAKTLSELTSKIKDDTINGKGAKKTS
jgi:aspartyl-tRNA(Asn)/glutamyl-tRNA(Gln) amidotransferase subunit B